MPRGRTPLTQMAASADCSTKSHRPLVPAPGGRSAKRLAPRNRPVTVTPLPMKRSGASASARRFGSSGSGDSTALAPRITNTCSRAGHWPFDAASRIGWKLTFEKRESVRSSRPRSQNSPRTSPFRGALGGVAPEDEHRLGACSPAAAGCPPAPRRAGRRSVCRGRKQGRPPGLPAWSPGAWMLAPTTWRPGASTESALARPLSHVEFLLAARARMTPSAAKSRPAATMPIVPSCSTGIRPRVPLSSAASMICRPKSTA